MNARQIKENQAAQIESCADALRPTYLAILRASLTDDYATMAANLAIPIGTVKSRLNRARAALAKVLAEKVPP